MLFCISDILMSYFIELLFLLNFCPFIVLVSLLKQTELSIFKFHFLFSYRTIPSRLLCTGSLSHRPLRFLCSFLFGVFLRAFSWRFPPTTTVAVRSALATSEKCEKLILYFQFMRVLVSQRIRAGNSKSLLDETFPMRLAA